MHLRVNNPIENSDLNVEISYVNFIRGSKKDRRVN